MGSIMTFYLCCQFVYNGAYILKYRYMPHIQGYRYFGVCFVSLTGIIKEVYNIMEF